MTQNQTPKVVMTDKLSAEWFADELNDLIHNAEGYGFTDEMVRRIEKRDAAIAAELVESLNTLVSWYEKTAVKTAIDLNPNDMWQKGSTLIQKYGAKS